MIICSLAKLTSTASNNSTRVASVASLSQLLRCFNINMHRRGTHCLLLARTYMYHVRIARLLLLLLLRAERDRERQKAKKEKANKII